MKKKDKKFMRFISLWLVFSLLAAGGITIGSNRLQLSTMLSSSGNEWHVDTCVKDDRVGDSVFHYNRNTKDLFVNGKILRPGKHVDGVVLLTQSGCEATVKNTGLQKFSAFGSTSGSLNNYLHSYSSWDSEKNVVVSPPRVTIQEYTSGMYLGGGYAEDTFSVSKPQVDLGIEAAYEPRILEDSSFLQNDNILSGISSVLSYQCDFQFMMGARYHGGNKIFERFVKDTDGDTYIDDFWSTQVSPKITSGKLDPVYFTATGGPYDLYATKTYKCSQPLGLNTIYAWSDTITYLKITEPLQTPAPTSTPAPTTIPVPTTTATPTSTPVPTIVDCNPTITGTMVDDTQSASSFSVQRVQGVGVKVGAKFTSSCAAFAVGFSSFDSNGVQRGGVSAMAPSAPGGLYTATIYSESLTAGANQIKAHVTLSQGAGMGYKSYDKSIGLVQVSSISTGPQGDSDGDGIRDEDDNCPNTRNNGQTDTDGDGLGDICDSSPRSPSGGSDLTITVVGWVIQSGKCVYVTSGAKYNYETACIDALNAGASTGVGNGSGDNATECPRLDFYVDEVPPKGKVWEYEYNGDKTCIMGRALKDAPVYKILPVLPDVSRFNTKLFIGLFGGLILLGIPAGMIVFKHRALRGKT